MADLTAIYTLTTPGGTITFNNGDLHTLTDLYWIGTIQGLDGAPIRATIDDAPQAHGGLVHNAWKGPRHVTMEGVILIQSVPLGSPCLTERNALENALRVALESILQADGTLAWTPEGLSARSLTVRGEVPLEYTPQENYAVMGFTFGLVAADPDF
jgi:hypothetical protein